MIGNIRQLPRIAVVEDELDILESTVDFLRALGYPVWSASSGEAFFSQLPASPVDVVVLDVQLPGEDGFSVANRLHQEYQLGIVIVSARSTLDDRLTGLARGADVYLVKPLDLRELVANIESVYRRLGKGSTDAESASVANSWLLDAQDWDLQTPGGGVLPLTPKEFLLVRALVDARGEVVSKARIASVLGGERGAGAVDFHAIDVLVARLRRKCQDSLGIPLPVRTVTGIGFVLTVAVNLVKN